jgi:predicted nucleotidyltransferase
MIEILKNATIVYIDGVKERFDAVRLTDKMVITGHILKSNGSVEFKEYGFISRKNVKTIYNGNKIKIQNMTT